MGEANDEAERNAWVDALQNAAAPSARGGGAGSPGRGGAVGGKEDEDCVFQRASDHGGFALPPGEKVGLDSFELLSVIGRGSFGKVMRVALKSDPLKRPLAMKIMRKDVIIREGFQQGATHEKAILQQIDHPFIVKLHFAFQTRERLYLILDLLSGGELFFHLKSEGRFSIQRAKLYCAEITSALRHLHARDIVYRDLKPENIVLDKDGHACLTDFGLAKTEISKELAHTFCGTPEYLAPEVLQGKAHGTAVDWWSLGCVLYEMLSGLPPFYSEDVNTMYDYILKKELTFDSSLIPPDAQDLISKWLHRDPAQRLANGDAAMAHPFFKDVDWAKLERREITPEWQPNPDAHATDEYVDVDFTAEYTGLSVVEAASQIGDAEFRDFTFQGRRPK